MSELLEAAEEPIVNEEVPTEEVPSEEPSSDEKAKALGWVDADDWNGEPDRHISSEDFLSKADNNMPLLKNNNDRLQKELADVRRTMDFMVGNQHKIESQAFERGRTELVKKQREAAEIGDMEAFDAVGQELSTLEAPVPHQAQQQAPEYADEFIGKHASWWNTDHAMRNTAIALDNEYANAGVPESERNAKVEEALAKDFSRFKPSAQTEQYQERPRTMSTQTRQPSKKPNAKSFDNLPADAKAACTTLIKQMKIMKKPYTQAEYVASYNWED